MTLSTMALVRNGWLRPLEPLQDALEGTVVNITIETPGVRSKEEQQAMLLAVPVAEELASAIEAGRNQPWRVEMF